MLANIERSAFCAVEPLPPTVLMFQMLDKFVSMEGHVRHASARVNCKVETFWVILGYFGHISGLWTDSLALETEIFRIFKGPYLRI